jgi:hypothetical protein
VVTHSLVSPFIFLCPKPVSLCPKPQLGAEKNSGLRRSDGWFQYFLPDGVPPRVWGNTTREGF